MGFGVWLVGVADQPHPKISSFRRLRRESRLGFYKASHFVKILGSSRLSVLYGIMGMIIQSSFFYEEEQ
jgi:hypothetical protein